MLGDTPQKTRVSKDRGPFHTHSAYGNPRCQKPGFREEPLSLEAPAGAWDSSPKTPPDVIRGERSDNQHTKSKS
jgi:hypothetical protein